MLRLHRTSQDSEKRVLVVESPDQMVPPDMERALKDEFQRRCAYGERMNLELMNSARWMRLLEDVRLVPPAQRGSGAAAALATSEAAPGTGAPLAEKLGAKRGAPEEDAESVATEAPPSEPGSFEERTLPRAAGDIIFRRVLHNCNHGGLRLDYELFCKALLLAGHMLWPEELRGHRGERTSLLLARASVCPFTRREVLARCVG